MNATSSISHFEWKIIRNDPTTPTLLFVTPLVFIALLHNVFSQNGVDAAAPAYAILFVFMISAWVIYSFFKEFGWSTWPRLRVAGLSVHAIIFAKTWPYIVLGIAQQGIVLAIGALATWDVGLAVHIPAMLVISASFVCLAVSFGFALAALCRNHMQASTIANLLVFVMGAVGGAMAPVNMLPHWARIISWLSPHRWALEGFKTLLAGGSLWHAWVWCVPLLLAALAFFLIGIWRFDETQPREFAY